MKIPEEVQQAFMFLEPARTMMDNAEFKAIMQGGEALKSADLLRASCAIAVAIRNLQWCMGALDIIAKEVAEKERRATTPV